MIDSDTDRFAKPFERPRLRRVLLVRLARPSWEMEVPLTCPPTYPENTFNLSCKK